MLKSSKPHSKRRATAERFSYRNIIPLLRKTNSGSCLQFCVDLFIYSHIYFHFLIHCICVRVCVYVLDIGGLTEKPTFFGFIFTL